MGFGLFAATVRDDTLPHARRMRALGSCVQMYRPIGFEATFAYLTELHGPLRRDPGTLTPALGTLVRSRDLWRADVARYAAGRRAAKARGARIPPATVPDPHARPPHWYGARRAAALAGLRHWRRRRLPRLLTVVAGPLPAALDACVSAALDTGGDLLEPHRRAFAETYARLAAGDHPWPAAEHFHARDLVTVARLVEMTLP